MDQNLKYSTKPTLKEFLEKERQSRTGPAPPTPATRRMRTRSLSSSGRLEQSQTINPKYANAKPKINSRPPIQSARLSGRMDSIEIPNKSKQNLNDSTALRFVRLLIYRFFEI